MIFFCCDLTLTFVKISFKDIWPGNEILYDYNETNADVTRSLPWLES